jgi:hypothetical protein
LLSKLLSNPKTVVSLKASRLPEPLAPAGHEKSLLAIRERRAHSCYLVVPSPLDELLATALKANDDAPSVVGASYDRSLAVTASRHRI